MRKKSISSESTNSSLIFQSEKSSVPTDIYSKNGRRSEFTLLHHSPIIRVRKPKDLKGPFDVLHLPEIRDAIKRRFTNDSERKQQYKLMSHQFAEQLKLTEYFSNKNNWNSKTKYINTYGLHRAMNTYLPRIKTIPTESFIKPENFENDLFDLKNEKKKKNLFDLNAKIDLSKVKKINFSSGDWL